MVTIELQNSKLVISTGYSPALIEKVRQINGRRYDGKRKVWEVPVSQVDAVLNAFPSAFVDDSVGEYRKNRRLREEIRAWKDAPQPAGVIRDFKDFQRVGVAWLRTLDAALLKDDPGLGKSCQSIAWAMTSLPCLIICNATSKWDYAGEIEATIGDKSIAVLDGRSGPFAPPGTNWVILNWDIIGHPKRRETIQDGREMAGRLGDIVEYGFKSVIFSEAHKAQAGAKSLRGQGALEIAGAIPRRLCETATPNPHRTEQLAAIFQLLGKLHKDQVFAWKKRYCDGQQIEVGHFHKKTVWDFSGKSNLDELSRIMADFTLGRKRADVGQQIPIGEFPKIVDITNRKEYAEKEREVMDLTDQIARIRRQRPTEEAEKEIYELRGKALGMREALVSTAAMGKIDAAMELVEPYALTGEKVIVFAEHLAPLRAMHEKLGAQSILLTGEISSAKARHEAVAKFQQDPDCLVALCSRKAFGESVTMTAAATVVFLSLPSTPTEYIQARDRINRITQKADRLQVFWLIGRKTHDAAVLNLNWPKAGMLSQIYHDPEMREYAERFRELYNLLEGKGGSTRTIPAATAGEQGTLWAQ